MKLSDLFGGATNAAIVNEIYTGLGYFATTTITSNPVYLMAFGIETAYTGVGDGALFTLTKGDNTVISSQHVSSGYNNIFDFSSPIFSSTGLKASISTLPGVTASTNPKLRAFFSFQ